MNPIPLNLITPFVAEFYGVSMANLKGHSRLQTLVIARHVCWYLARQHTRLSLLEVGKFFGGRDHTSIMHGVHRIAEQMKTDLTLNDQIAWLEKNIVEQQVARARELVASLSERAKTEVAIAI
jgi:chromosomal replication initiation ATPase DnaA